MIESVYISSPYLQVSGGSAYTYISNSYSGQPGIGNMRYNPSTHKIEVFDGMSWIQMASGTINVGLTHDAIQAIDWAKKKMVEEMELDAIGEEHPSIKDLVDQIKAKKEQIKMIQTLIRSPGNETVESSPVL